MSNSCSNGIEELLFSNWNFFINQDHSPNSPYIQKIDKLIEILPNHLPSDFTKRIHQMMSIHLDFLQLQQHCWPEFQQNLLLDPFNTLGCIKLAILIHYHRARASSSTQPSTSFSIGQTEIGQIFVRLENCAQFGLTFEELKSDKVGNFVFLRGTVARISQTRPIPIRMEFFCAKCGNPQTKCVEDGILNSPPEHCVFASCKSRSFLPNKHGNANVLVEKQRIKIQQISSQEQTNTIDSLMEEGGKIPKTFEVELEGDLVNSVKPGDVVEVAGILRLATDCKASSILNLFCQANSMRLEGSTMQFQRQSSSNNILRCTSPLQSQANTFFQDGFQLEDLAASIAPSIFGNEMVKLGLLLCLFGGASHNGKRKDSHCLLIGDPGMGKSQMLCGISKLCSRFVYVCGNTASNAGLTVSLVRESASNDFALEAGALLLADKGICCIDEFDKMLEFRSLLEAMEQQTVSIAKAGVVCSLPCRSTVIAAANPIGGHFDESKSCIQNLRIDSAILTRFDLIFVLLDRPNRSFDRILSSHVVRGRGEFVKASSCSAFHSLDSTTATASSSSLQERLKKGKPLEAEIVQKYIAYARENIHPRLSSAASDYLKEAYLRLRKTKTSGNQNFSLPITARSLESLIRLCEARAKASLSQMVTLEHAEEIVELYHYCISSFAGSGEAGSTKGGKSLPKAANKKKFLAALESQALASSPPKTEFTTQELELLGQKFQIENFPEFLHLLNMNGFLLKTSSGNWKRI